ncbi:MAG: AraC family transcriptional regulator [Bacteroidetes bacterium]|nr:MAG: AraC family transcriptional regulator [Bacteroidota bacterium]
MKLQFENVQISKATASYKFLRLDQPGFNGNWHYHPELELTYIERGEGIRFMGDHIGSFTGGDLVLVGEQLPHNWISAENHSEENCIAYVFQFEKDLFSQFPECIPLMKLFRQSSKGIHFLKPSEQLLLTIQTFESLTPAERLFTLMKILNDLQEDKNRMLLSSISYNEAPPKAAQNKVSNITNYIMERLDKPLPLEEIAHFSKMTTTSFCRWFKNATGNSFVNYLNSARIEKACYELLHSDKRVSEIAYSTGFETVGHFNRTFKKLKGIPPSQYRKNFI